MSKLEMVYVATSLDAYGMERHTVKINRVRALSATARHPRTFDERLAAIPQSLLTQLTARQIAAIIDGPMQASYQAGHAAGYKDAR